MRRCRLPALLMLAALAAGGCASRRCCSPAVRSDPAVLDCQPVERHAISPDVSAISPRSKVTFEERRYCNLPEREAQCLAATTAPLAKLLEQEADALACQPQGIHQGSDCVEQILYLQATHERNRAAAAALQLFLRLAEAEGGAANLKLRLEEVGDLMADVQRLQTAGVESTLSRSSVEAQQLELLHKQVDLEVTIEELNHQLVNLLGAEPPPDARLWPAADLRVDPAIPSVSEAQQLARRQRCDLAALRLAACCDVEVMRTLLGQANSGLGLSLGPCQALAALHLTANACEGDVRSEQLSAAVDEQQRTLAHDVARAIATMEGRLVQIGLSRGRLDALGRQHQRLLEKRQIDAASAFEARKARLDVLAAEQDLLHDVIQWKLAVVRLRELQGELGRECGFVCNMVCD